jgi:L-ascorbate metabolism protein UlaG (beta-lactamase superfamily)
MRITFIGHASLLIEANRLNIVSDPWWNGPCFGAQWLAAQLGARLAERAPSGEIISGAKIPLPHLFPAF